MSKSNIRIKSLISVERKKESVTIKMTQKQKDKIQKMADLYAGGNMSDWIRYAAVNHKPKKSELAKI